MTNCITICNIITYRKLSIFFESYGGVLASTYYKIFKEHVELGLGARKKKSQKISAESKGSAVAQNLAFNRAHESFGSSALAFA